MVQIQWENPWIWILHILKSIGMFDVFDWVSQSTSMPEIPTVFFFEVQVVIQTRWIDVAR